MSETSLANNKRIAKNMVAMYIRLFLTVVVGIYTSRVVLQVLGVDDYGIYNVVGGIVGMLIFLNASMTTSTARFLSYSIGEGDQKKLDIVFSSALLIHLIIAIFIFILCETVGLWFLYNKLSIPEHRMNAAFWVLQFSIIQTVITIIQTPFGAAMNAHEHMTVYAYVEIYNAIMKLLIVILLQYWDWDKLIMYAALYLILGLSIVFFYNTYCRKHFSECRFRLCWNPPVIKSLCSFSLWNLYSSFSTSVQRQGLAFLLNMFFGTVANAATGIANTLNGIIIGFAYTLCMVVDPQIVKSFATKDFSRLNQLVCNSYKYSLLLFQLMAIPLFIEAKYVLDLWLVDVPEYTVIFVRIIVAISLISMGSRVLTQAIRATGEIETLSLISGTLTLCVVLFTYISYKLGQNAQSGYIIMLIVTLIIQVFEVVLLKKQIQEVSLKYILLYGCTISCLIVGINYICCDFVSNNMEEGFIRLLCVCATSVIVSSLLTYYVALDSYQRAKVLTVIKYRMHALNINSK
ncbi:MAG: polysaccharide biosynthesis protein [Paludibacteraceae bacterium]|nr:polysaccharide biosynthesis protein [Paludibacteraceae bacterium]